MHDQLSRSNINCEYPYSCTGATIAPPRIIGSDSCNGAKVLLTDKLATVQCPIERTCNGITIHRMEGGPLSCSLEDYCDDVTLLHEQPITIICSLERSRGSLRRVLAQKPECSTVHVLFRARKLQSHRWYRVSGGR
ncbi:hypothetical protein IV203_033575 [Nitzschia inconspicua]|uniref:Uncharacterized protein n=1 Tax=Nitzschia inconspicua TaxID=303405 RepID=A0A9K3Q6V8_9STRA|nr:hypothetical protein IV203_033575 [Nitzschia inconspicua]